MLYSQLLRVMRAGGLVQIWQNLALQSVSGFVDLTGPLASSAFKFLKIVQATAQYVPFLSLS